MQVTLIDFFSLILGLSLHSHISVATCQLQPPTPARKQCDNLWRKRQQQKNKLCIIYWTNITNQSDLPYWFLSCLLKSNAHPEAPVQCGWKGVECHWLSSSALRLPSDSLILRKSAALQHRQLYLQRGTEIKEKKEREFFLHMKMNLYSNF